MASKRSKQGGVRTPQLFEPAPPTPPQAADAVELVERNLLDYALYVIGDRAVPSVADGLKPVARRLLWGALNGAPPAIPGRPTVKCARVTGETMAKYHPHGDSYLALVRMAQPFSLRAPLFEFQGNYGSPDFGPAASRYTETRLSPVAMALLAEVRDGTVDLVPNYDGLEVEPEVLPAGFPNLFVNGSYGIAFGMASHFPTHNPVEVCAAAQHLIANPKASVEELLAIVPGPDYPDPCTIVNGDELAAIYRSGTGQIRVRGTWIVEEARRGVRLIVTSLPYVNGSTGSSEEFIRGVVAAVEEGKLLGIDDVVNESAKGETRIAIDLAKGVAPEQVVPALLRFTNLQVTNPVRMHALDVHGVPQMYNLRTALEAWIAHRVDVVERRSRARIGVITDRLHLLDGLLTVLLDIDAAIAIIRGSDDVAEARAGLMARFELDEVQANYVLDLTLRRLTRLARVELEKEQTALQRELARLEALVASPGKLRRQVGTELAEVANMFVGIERHTEITTAALPSATVAIPDEPMELVVLDSGYVQAFKASAKVRTPREGVVVRRIASSHRHPSRGPHRDRPALPGDRGLVPHRQTHRRGQLAHRRDQGTHRGVGLVGFVARRSAARHERRHDQAHRRRRPRRRRPQGRHLDHQVRARRDARCRVAVPLRGALPARHRKGSGHPLRPRRRPPDGPHSGGGSGHQARRRRPSGRRGGRSRREPT